MFPPEVPEALHLCRSERPGSPCSPSGGRDHAGAFPSPRAAVHSAASVCGVHRGPRGPAPAEGAGGALRTERSPLGFPRGPCQHGACPPHPGSRRPWRVPCPRGLSTWCPASKASSMGRDGGDGSWGECPRASRPAGPGPPEPGGVECLSTAVMGVKGLDVGGVGSGPVRCVAFHQGTVTFLPRPPLTAGAEPHKVAEAAPSPTKPAQEGEH